MENVPTHVMVTASASPPYMNWFVKCPICQGNGNINRSQCGGEIGQPSKLVYSCSIHFL
jgi:hypothetical protein